MFIILVEKNSGIIYNKRKGGDILMIVKLADLIIEIKNKKDYTAQMCTDYIYTGTRPIDFSVESTRENMLAEIKKQPDYPLDYLESLCLYRQICEKILAYDALLLHAAAIAVDGKAYLFTAVSGTGKTTHINLWLKKFGSRAVIVNGDKPIVRRLNGTFHVCGTPWSGKEGLHTNINVPIQGICILERAEKNTIVKISPQAGLHGLLTQTVRPHDIHKMDMMLSTLNALLDSVPLYRLGCNMDTEAAEVSYQGMRGK